MTCDASRNLQDWEIEEYEHLLQTLFHIHLSDSNDKLIWQHTKSGNFLVKSLYKTLVGNNLQEQTKFLPNIIWKSGATPRISFFAWEAANGRILTLDNLMKKSFTIVNRYFLYKNSYETCNHLLLECSVSHNLLMGLSWVKYKSILDELLAWEGLSCHKKTFRFVALTIFWVIWKKRNNCTFEEKKKVDFRIITDKWFYYFGSTILKHDIECFDDLISIVNCLTIFKFFVDWRCPLGTFTSIQLHTFISKKKIIQ